MILVNSHRVWITLHEFEFSVERQWTFDVVVKRVCEYEILWVQICAMNYRYVIQCEKNQLSTHLFLSFLFSGRAVSGNRAACVSHHVVIVEAGPHLTPPEKPTLNSFNKCFTHFEPIT